MPAYPAVSQGALSRTCRVTTLGGVTVAPVPAEPSPATRDPAEPDPPGTRSLDRARYLASLIGSWQAFCAVAPGARVIAGRSWVAARFPTEPLLDNALLLGSAD